MIYSLFIDVFPSFLASFSYNLFISVIAMIIGIIAGLYLAKLYQNERFLIRLPVRSLLALLKNIPSFVLLFYLTLIIPNSITVLDISFSISPIAKAIFALSAPVAYFAAIYFVEHDNNEVFQLMAWNQYFIVILMASTTASVIGVKEIMATANTFIAIKGDSSLILPIYTIVAVWFIGSSLLLSVLIKSIDWCILYLSRQKDIG